MRVALFSRGNVDYISSSAEAFGKVAECHLFATHADECFGDLAGQHLAVHFTGAPTVKDIRNIPRMVELRKAIKALKPDILHFHSGLGAYWEWFATQGLNIPRVLTLHDVIKHPTRSKFRFVPQSVLDIQVKQADSVIVHGEKLKQFADQRFTVIGERSKFFSVEHGIVSRYGFTPPQREKSEEEEKIILLFGAIDTRKGVEFLVQAEPLLRKVYPNFKIIIAGGCSDPKYYGSLISDDQKIDFRPSHQNNDEVKKLFIDSDVIVLPYVEASQSGVLQLAFSFARPAIVSNVGGLPDVIQDNRNGLVIEPGSAQQLADAIYQLLSNDVLRKKIIENVEYDRSTRFCWNTIANKTIEVYKETIERKAQK